MSAPEVAPLITAITAVDRRLERLDVRIDAALDANDRDQFQHLLRLRGELLSQRNELGGVDEPPC